MKKSLALAVSAVALFAGGPAFAANEGTSDKAYELANRLAQAIETCWTNAKDPTFADYVYSPEPNASNGPRILIVPRKNPTSAPLLAIEINKSGGHVSVFGYLATSPNAGRIGADLKRWINGDTACGT